ncbi:MAG TPA: D-xylose transporter subunit XylF [Spirochaetaceae bacterium]|nr:D-xylose transporter subunit XylF [Spirochaetaceae bacterium]
MKIERTIRTTKPAKPFAVLPTLTAIAFSLALVLALAGCDAAKKQKSKDKAPRIGFSLDSLVVERWKRDIDIFEKAVQEMGAEFILEVADQDASKQDEQVRALVDKGIDILVIVPNDADKLTQAVKYVKSRKIPVLSYDRLVRKANVDLYVSFDNEKVGSLMAESLTRAIPEGNYVIINGARTDNNAIMLNAGMHKVLDPLVAAGNIRIIREIWPENWNSEDARKGLEAVIASNRKIDAVIAGNDMLAEAAINVLAENQLLGSAKVVGQDAELSACQRIAEGVQYATIYKPIERLALKAAGFAIMLARGEKIAGDVTIDDGGKKVPYVRLEPILVTRELLDETVIKDGFHSAEAIYRNLGR